MPTTSKVFVDTNVFVALLDKKDSTHKKSRDILQKLDKEGVDLVTTTDVVGETLTVISRKLGKVVARNFYAKFILASTVEIVFVNPVLQKKAIKLFFNTKSKNISYVDCTSVAAMKQNKIKHAFTFNEDFRKLGVKLFS